MRLNPFNRALLLGIASVTIGGQAQAKSEISPYIELQQIIDAEFGNGGDVLGYSTFAAGIDASVSNRNIQAQGSYRFEERVPWSKRETNEELHDGVFRGRASILPNLLSIEGGAIATRSRSDIRDTSVGSILSGNNNLQVYGLYGGPSLNTKIGALAIGLNYRIGHISVNSNGVVVPVVGQPTLGSYDNSTSHDVNFSIGMPTKVGLPFSWTVTGGYVREDTSQLDQRYNGKFIRDDVTWPITAAIALTGGIGYERILIQERAPVLGLDGFPIVNSNGRYVTDPNSPLLTAFHTSAVIWDVGFIFKPNRRITLQARGGERYGQTAVVATFDYEITHRTALRAGLFNGVDSFGRAMTRDLATLPTSFIVNRDPITGEFGSCIFGTQAGTGGCFGDSTQSASTSNYRSRGVYVVMNGRRGPWTFGLGGNYTNRKYLAPVSPGLFSLNGVVDRSVTAQADVMRNLTATSTVSGRLYANWYRSGLPAGGKVRELGYTVSYNREFGRRLMGYAAVGAYTNHADGTGSTNHAQLSFGLRYRF